MFLIILNIIKCSIYYFFCSDFKISISRGLNKCHFSTNFEHSALQRIKHIKRNKADIIKKNEINNDNNYYKHFVLKEVFGNIRHCICI